MAAVSHDYWKLGLRHGASYVSPGQQLLCYGRPSVVQSGGGQSNAVLGSGAGESAQAVAGSSSTNIASGGDYVVSANETISSPQSAYKVLELLGMFRVLGGGGGGGR